MPKMTNVLRRQLSADERIQRYFRQVEKEVLQSFRLARVEQDTPVGTLVLQVVKVYHSGDGITIKVR